MTVKERNQLNARAEAVLMGMPKKVANNDEAIEMIDYILKVMGDNLNTGSQVFNDATQYSKNAQAQHLCCNTICGMRMLAITLTTDDDEEPYNLTNENGVLAYVYNFDATYCSELGYVFFQKQNGRVHRIG